MGVPFFVPWEYVQCIKSRKRYGIRLGLGFSLCCVLLHSPVFACFFFAFRVQGSVIFWSFGFGVSLETIVERWVL